MMTKHFFSIRKGLHLKCSIRMHVWSSIGTPGKKERREERRKKKEAHPVFFVIGFRQQQATDYSLLLQLHKKRNWFPV